MAQIAVGFDSCSGKWRGLLGNLVGVGVDLHCHVNVNFLQK